MMDEPRCHLIRVTMSRRRSSADQPVQVVSSNSTVQSNLVVSSSAASMNQTRTGDHSAVVSWEARLVGD